MFCVIFIVGLTIIVIIKSKNDFQPQPIFILDDK